MNPTFRWTVPDSRLESSLRPGDHLCVATAILDGFAVSALFWLALLLIVH
jgi:hypothetical protein